MKSICVFCSAYEVDDTYQHAAKEFGTLIGSRGYRLVWGGTDTGLMKIVASSAQEAGAKITGISIPIYHEKARKHADEMIVAKDLYERKSLFLEKSDAFVALVGGIGTLDEVSEILELKKQGRHHKPIVILNTDGFYDGLKIQMQTIDHKGFIPYPLDHLVHFATTPAEAIEYII